jgi:hypothetical protein
VGEVSGYGWGAALMGAILIVWAVVTAKPAVILAGIVLIVVGVGLAKLSNRVFK